MTLDDRPNLHMPVTAFEVVELRRRRRTTSLSHAAVFAFGVLTALITVAAVATRSLTL
jgi:hypothetical protein